MPPIREIREGAVSDAERLYLRELMTMAQGDISEACQVSGLARARLYELLKKYNITR